MVSSQRSCESSKTLAAGPLELQGWGDLYFSGMVQRRGSTVWLYFKAWDRYQHGCDLPL